MTTRRFMIKQLAVLSAGIVMLNKVNVLPRDEEADYSGTSKAILAAFADSIVPGVKSSCPDFVGIFNERIFGFRKFKWLLVTDLRNRGRRLFGNSMFHRLSPDQRNNVISDGLQADGIVGRLYSGALQIVQVGFYTGYRNSPEGCRNIDFNSAFQPVQMAYSKPNHFFGESLTANGNLS